VDITNKVGVDVNRAVTDPYYQHLLPFVCGLGPRKAQVVVKKIAAIVSVTPRTIIVPFSHLFNLGRESCKSRSICQRWHFDHKNIPECCRLFKDTA